jgi:hypothetical protein
MASRTDPEGETLVPGAGCGKHLYAGFPTELGKAVADPVRHIELAVPEPIDGVLAVDPEADDDPARYARSFQRPITTPVPEPVTFNPLLRLSPAPGP